jgi:hypothetical protein
VVRSIAERQTPDHSPYKQDGRQRSFSGCSQCRHVQVLGEHHTRSHLASGVWGRKQITPRKKRQKEFKYYGYISIILKIDVTGGTPPVMVISLSLVELLVILKPPALSAGRSTDIQLFLSVPLIWITTVRYDSLILNPRKYLA